MPGSPPLQLLHVSRYISVPIAVIAVWVLVVLGNYRYAERVFLLLSLVFIAYPISAVLAHPDWGSATGNLVLPRVLATRSFILLAVALIGTTITPYMQFYVAAAVAEKGASQSDYPLTRLDRSAARSSLTWSASSSSSPPPPPSIRARR